ncbi:MAG: hypothetical protein V2A74_02440, partial [bacterium]
MNAIKTRNNPLKASNPFPESNTTYGIWSPRDGTAYAAAESGIVFHWTPQGISVLQTDKAIDFYDVFGFTSTAPDGSSQTDLWAIGTFGAVRRFDGSNWTVFDPPHLTPVAKEGVWFEAIWGRSPDDIYVGGAQGGIYHFNGAEWRVVQTGDTRRRFYSAFGLDDGTTYMCGSGGTLFKLKGGVATEVFVPPGLREEFLGIIRVPNTDKFLICGKNNTLLWLENDKLTPVPVTVDLPKPKAKARFYGLDAKSEREIVVVGWDGATVIFDGVNSFAQTNSGANSYMEGVVYVGGDCYVASGWYGRIMSLRRQNSQWRWTTHQTGRGEQINAVALNSGGKFAAVADTGDVLCGDAANADAKLIFAPPVDLNVVALLDNNRFVIAGQRSYLAVLDLGQTPPALADDASAPSDSCDFLCFSPFDGGAFLAATGPRQGGGQGARLYRYDAQGLTELAAFRNFQDLNGKVIKALAHVSNDLFYIHYDKTIARANLQNMKFDKLVLDDPDSSLIL